MSSVVPELLVKKRKRDEQFAAEKAASLVEGRKKSRGARKDIFKRAESYVKEYLTQVCTLAAPVGFAVQLRGWGSWFKQRWRRIT